MSPSFAAVLITAIVAVAGVRALRLWLEWKRQLDERHVDHTKQQNLSIESRIGLADVKERLRRLESIADGIDV